MTVILEYGYGIGLSILLALFAMFISSFIPYHLVSASVFALLIGMWLQPVVMQHVCFKKGLGFVSKQLLRFSIILMGLNLTFSQVLKVGGYSLFVMLFTLFTAFGGGFILGKMLGLPWKLSSLISAGTGICGGSAILAISGVIDAENKDVAYAISATFLFDVFMVLAFPLLGRALHLSDLGYGLWTGTAVNDTSSVVAVGYAFSDAAGAYSVIVKLTRTLAIIPTVLVFSYINARKQSEKKRVAGHQVFPYFILLFLVMVGIRSTNLVAESITMQLSELSKFLMVMSLGSIGMRTNFRQMVSSGFKPMLHGFLISLSVVVVSYLVQLMLHQI